VLQQRRLIEERQQVLEALRESEARYRGLFDRVPVGLYQSTPEGQFLDANPALVEMLGCTNREELLSANTADFYVDAHERERWQSMMEKEGVVQGFEVRFRRRDGAAIWVRNSARTVHDAHGEMLYYEGSLEDITERKQAEETIKRMAYHDALTGLPNRRLFSDRMNIAMARAYRNRKKLAVMLLDLDDFKDVNDRLGHSVGDRLLQVVGQRLTGLLRQGDTVARMGGDEFMVLLPEVAGVEGAAEVAQKILESIRESYVLDGHELHVSTSVGIALYPDDGEDAETLMRNADIAMYRAKDQGRNNYQLWQSIDREQQA
jgi:diguanylate cyclase (GGDEF)-like protein/PAS domain S-box-containing protein